MICHLQKRVSDTLHKVSILKHVLNPLGAHVIIDDKKVGVRSYKLSQSIDEIPVLKLEIPFLIDEVKRDCCKIEFDRLDDLARIMDEKELNSFVSMWQKYHSEGE